MSDLTILSVSFRSEAYLEENLRLASELNGDCDFEWIIVNNDPGRPFPKGNARPGFRVLDGPPPVPARKGSASYHHAYGLNLGLQAVKSRYLLVLDPDFYILPRGWMGRAMAHMRSHDLSFLGCVWNPQDYHKPRYFPSVHCMFVDLDKVDKSDLDFTPELDTINRRKWILNKLHIPRRIRELVMAGASRDTGYRILRTFRGHRDCRYEVFQPICLDESFLEGYENSLHQIWRRLLPDRFSLYPKRPGYISGPEGTTAADSAWMKMGWEGFRWQNEVFSVHLRNYGRRQRDPESEFALLREYLRRRG